MRSDEALILDILIAARRIVEMTGTISKSVFKADYRIHGAVIREFMVIGEASRVLSIQAKTRWPDINWRSISNMRNVLVHEYFAIEFELLWDVVRNDIPDLIRQIESLIPPDDDEDTVP